MAAPLFTTSEINHLLSLKKVVPYDAWEGAWGTRKGVKRPIKINVITDDSEQMEFSIEAGSRPGRDEFSITLFAKPAGRQAEIH